MKIFFAYGYNPADQWVEDLVFPIIQSFGSDVVTGENTYGDSIPDSVKAKINRSDALIGFTTRRTSTDNKVWQTHHWVLQELGAAFQANKRIVEVRQEGVDPQGGLTLSYQRIEYSERQRDKCLVEIVKAVGRWHQTDLVKIQLLPRDLAHHSLRPLLGDPGLQCKYTVRSGSHDEEAVEARITPIGGGLFIDAPSVPPGALIRIEITHGFQAWFSDYESVDSYAIHLERKPGGWRKNLKRLGSMLPRGNNTGLC